MQIDALVIHGQVVTCHADAPKRGAALREVGLIPDGALAIHHGQIVDVGPTDTLAHAYAPAQVIDASGRAVIPGLVDAHTHLIYGGDRLDDFERRLAGTPYLDILAAGGGLLSTVRATRHLTADALAQAARPRLRRMLSAGTTTAEVKTGYGLSLPAELAMLEALAILQRSGPLDLVPTFLGAHAVPPEYADNPQGYVSLVTQQMLPAVTRWYADSPCAARGLPLSIDVFCEDHAFTVEQAGQILEAGRRHGLLLRAHVDQFNALGGLEMALGLGAASVDHLEVAPPAGVAALATSSTAAVLLPACSHHLGGGYAPARALIDAGAWVVLATDHNPGSSPAYGLPLVMGLACRQMQVSPAEALNAVTVNAAHALGLGAQCGSLAAGKWADFVILDSPDWRDLPYTLGCAPVAEVYKHGQRVFSAPASFADGSSGQ